MKKMLLLILLVTWSYLDLQGFVRFWADVLIHIYGVLRQVAEIVLTTVQQ